ncbi:UDP-N-acetyl-D-mannosaminuronic acid transferase [Actinocatenispora thailandica]|uniref:UDP-N-acetyl-D-mannosaminuronic acid transferase n=1 Tax=Actinocatenispora thailandica TaxID=227318 RepID=A0A7R7I0R1_9ACTN|nr:WecB/TagA/CpsF family glycosyltransferase [Actinocatenispora thailandica]BCJ38288.1 UDP-N-acetyl-D-mannosaminuronic acid transferase [Actinocatenispora thailandica]
MIDRGKGNVLGVCVDAVDYEAATDKVLAAAREQRPLALTALAVHGVMTGVQDRAHEARLNSFDVVTPDGQPVRWALNLLHKAQLPDRTYGPTLTLKVVERCAAEGLPIYLYGSTQPVLDKLSAALTEQFGGLKIAGAEPSKFRSARPGEPAEIARRISDSGARVVLVGLGCPRQEIFVHAMRPLLSMPLLAVGAAFDYHAGDLRKPPPWMQQRGLEWLWRLGLEPKRLWRRYLILNPAYLARLGAQASHLWRARPAEPTSAPADSFAV